MRFSELCENRRVSSHQMLTGRTDRLETALEIMNDHARQKHKGADVIMFTSTDIAISTVMKRGFQPVTSNVKT